MVNRERTRWMTKLALYENGQGRKELKITKYLPGDYVTGHLLWSFVCGTIAFVIVLALGALYNIEDFMLDIFSMDILRFARNILLSYIAFISIYLCICYTCISYRYGKYKRRVNKYLRDVKELYRHYVQTEGQNN